MTPPLRTRFLALDELRAVAVFSMCVAHFAPGVIERFTALQPFGDLINVIGRLATVAFVVCFGLTLGFIQFPRFVAGQRKAVRDGLLARARLLAVCAVLVSVPAYLRLLGERGFDAPFAAWMWSTYSVLNFYVLALLAAPLWLWMLRRDTAMRAALLAALHWMAFALLHAAWPLDPASPYIEYARLQLISGGYAYLPLAATSLLAIPVGVWVRLCRQRGEMGTLAQSLFAGGVVLALAGFGLGLATDMSLHGIADGSLKGPARLWYWALFGGITLTLLALLAVLHLSWPRAADFTWPVALFGQSALAIYTTHGWTLPLLDALDHVVVVEGGARVAVALAIFGSACAVSMRYQSLKNARRARQAPPPRSVPPPMQWTLPDSNR